MALRLGRRVLPGTKRHELPLRRRQRPRRLRQHLLLYGHRRRVLRRLHEHRVRHPRPTRRFALRWHIRMLFRLSLRGRRLPEWRRLLLCAYGPRLHRRLGLLRQQLRQRLALPVGAIPAAARARFALARRIRSFIHAEGRVLSPTCRGREHRRWRQAPSSRSEPGPQRPPVPRSTPRASPRG
jgi:hypothetical protein